MSELVEERLLGLLDHPHFDPYGNPIPGLPELGEQLEEVDFLDGVVSLPVHLAQHGPGGGEVRVVLQRIAEPVQVDVDLLARFAQAGVLPRRTLVVRPAAAGGVTVQGEGAPVVLDLPDDVARHLFVARG